MSEPVAFDAKLRGRDATHRTRTLDTHLTHGCIQLFHKVLRMRRECAVSGNRQSRAFAGDFANAPRTLAEVGR